VTNDHLSLPEINGVSKVQSECLLCNEHRKGKRITFYSGVRKAGSRTELLTATITIPERWRDLVLHEAHVCRECQARLWAQHSKWPPILCGIGAAVSLPPAVPIAVFGGGTGMVIGIGLVIAALAAGGAGAWFYIQGQKPQRAQMESLIVREAMTLFPDEGRTFMTNDQYVDLVDRGIIG
jgi:hypothetical protein